MEPWQLRLFRKTLKKKQRLGVFSRLLGQIPPEKQCLLVTCGDNNGAMNYHLRRLGGRWSWADLEGSCIREMTELLGDEVRLARQDLIPFEDETFEYVIAIDVHEHIEKPEAFTLELKRVATRSARIFVTVPGGDEQKLVNKMKRSVGMTKERYGHMHDGFSASALKTMLSSNGISPVHETSFSKFFSELIELAINVTYVRVLAARSNGAERSKSIAPQTHDQLRSIEMSYRIYSILYPTVWLLSQLDKLLFFTNGYVVVVEGRRRA